MPAGGSLGSSIPTFDFNLSELGDYTTDSTGATVFHRSGRVPSAPGRPASQSSGRQLQGGPVTLDSQKLDEWLANAARELPRSMTDAIKRRAVSEASAYYVQQLQARTPQFDTGQLRRSMTRAIRSYTRRGRRGSAATKYFLGVVGPAVVTGPHAHLVEFGTVDRHTRRGLFRGRMPPRAFFEEIFRTSVLGGQQIIEDTVRDGLTRAYQRIATGRQA